MKYKNVEIAIIGAGTAGLTARKQVAKITDNYVVIDGGEIGTTCARVGCMPSKVMIQVANDYYRKKLFESIGIKGSDHLSIDGRVVMQHIRKLRDRFVSGVLNEFDTWQKGHFIREKAHFLSKDTLAVGKIRIKANKIIIATGSKPVIPNSWLDVNRYIIDTNSIFDMKELPEKIAVIGLGVVGIEIGQALHRLGVDVIGIGKGCAIGGLSNPDMINYASTKFSEEMQLDFTGVEKLVEKDNKLIITTKSKQYTVQKAFVAIGRKPNIKNLGLETIGFNLNENGLPEFNPSTLQVKDTSIFIAGDANKERPLLHECVDEGTIAGCNAASAKITAFKRRTYLSVTFCEPNIGVVGLSYRELVNRRIDFEVGSANFEGQGRSIIMLQEVGVLQIYGCTKTKKILGAELFCPAGEHMAHLLAWVISKELTVQEALSLPFYHPVVEEGIRTALRDLCAKLMDPDTNIELSTLDLQFSSLANMIH